MKKIGIRLHMWYFDEEKVFFFIDKTEGKIIVC